MRMNIVTGAPINGANHRRRQRRQSSQTVCRTSGIRRITEVLFWPALCRRGAEAEVPIQLLSELESDAGEQIAYDLLAELKMAPVEGDDILEGKEEAQRFYTDTIYIDQARCGVNTGGRMTRKRTLHNLREKARRQQSSWWARLRMNSGSSTCPELAGQHQFHSSDWIHWAREQRPGRPGHQSHPVRR